MPEKRAEPGTERGDHFASPGTEPEPSTEPSHDGSGYPRIGDSFEGTAGAIGSSWTQDIRLRLRVTLGETRPAARPNTYDGKSVVSGSPEGESVAALDDGVSARGDSSPGSAKSDNRRSKGAK